jgi:hypothetical protein
MENQKITLKYILTEEEMDKCANLVLGNRRYTSAIVRTVIFAVLIFIFSRQYIFSVRTNYPLGIGLVIICIVMTVFSWISPGRTKIKFLKDLLANNDFNLDITQDEISIMTKDLTEPEVVKLENISVNEEDDLYILTATDGGMIFIPKRAINPQDQDAISKILTDKTDEIIVDEIEIDEKTED